MIPNTLRDRVFDILCRFEEASRNDNYLVAIYWEQYNATKIVFTQDGRPSIRLRDYASGLLTSASLIERTRRLIQEECVNMPERTDTDVIKKIEMCLKVMPRNFKVLSKRRLRCAMWTNYIVENKIAIEETYYKKLIKDKIENNNNNC